MDIPVERFKEIIRGFENRRIAVFGDVVADIYIYGKPLRLSREAPVLVVRHEGEKILPGSAGNTIHNLSCLGVRVLPLGVVGDDEAGRALVNQFSRMNVDLEGLIVLEHRGTTTKTRIMAGDDHTSKQQVIRIDREVREPLPKEVEERLAAYLDRISGQVDALIVSDYGYNLVTPMILDKLKALAAHKTVVVDSRHRFALFSGVTAITPNESEAEAVSREKITSSKDALRVGRRLVEELDLKAVLITRGNKGMVLVERSGEAHDIAICGSDEITDVTGAGDTVAVVLTASLSVGATFYEAARLSNYAGAVVVMKSGTATASPEELLRVIEEDYKLKARS
ncbi:MAG: bifunctional hydroxymethylpyrimidine kinase/phosphomethylpyrimidine kinase [Deltaproteobacteria bacterium]|nr:bifunctional hydroxymethylpyrimidine kinase/phosphomethylpyrimidine kinase [Deltaproteobacteria bacterium]MBW2121911.1 bifunctional hydroxymethylpyrimidine kinase/phosphomethylpyrimidine kinase [Deltaproteobacteria bacterium]